MRDSLLVEAHMEDFHLVSANFLMGQGLSGVLESQIEAKKLLRGSWALILLSSH